MKTEFSERLLTLIYGKYANEWKLDYLSVGNFKIYDLTSTEHFVKADSLYKNDHLIPALNSVFAGRMCSQPIHELLTFQDQVLNDSIADKVIEDFSLAYPIPLDLQSIGITGEITYLTIVPIKSGQFFPYVAYRTDQPLNEIAPLEKENIYIHSKIETLLPNIKEGYQGIVYGVFNEQLEENTQPEVLNILRENVK